MKDGSIEGENGVTGETGIADRSECGMVMMAREELGGGDI